MTGVRHRLVAWSLPIALLLVVLAAGAYIAQSSREDRRVCTAQNQTRGVVRDSVIALAPAIDPPEIRARIVQRLTALARPGGPLAPLPC